MGRLWNSVSTALDKSLNELILRLYGNDYYRAER